MLYYSRYVHRFIISNTFFRCSIHTINPKISKFCNYTPENGYVWGSPYESFQIPNMPLHEYIWNDLNKWHEKVAVACGITGRKYTYAKLRDYCAVFSMNLHDKLKLKRNDVVLISLPNCPEYAVVALGTIEAGLILSTVNPIYSALEVARQLDICKPKLIIGQGDGYRILSEACSIAKQSIKIMLIREHSQTLPSDTINFFEMIEIKGKYFHNFKFENINPADVCLLPFSSGTTGLPKGVMLNHINLNSAFEIFNSSLPTEKICQETTTDFQDVLPCFLPFFHSYGLICTLFSKLALGCQLITLPKYDFDTFSNALLKYNSTVLHLLPSLIIALSKMDQFTMKHLQSIRIIMYGGAPLGKSDVERFKLKGQHVKFFQAYGLTETSPIAIISEIGKDNYSTVGYPTSNTEIKLISMIQDNIKGKNLYGLGPNEYGEILIRGPQVMQGYLNNPEVTAETIIDGGWLRSGDIGSYDTDGLFYIQGRLKELIKVKGFQVAPAELEEVLRSHAKVLDAGVIGIPHPLKGEVPRAFIVKRPSIQVSSEEIQNYVADKLSKYKHLDGGVQFVDSIPRNPTGKILRNELKVLYKNNC